MQFRRQGKDFAGERSVDFEGLRIGSFVQLADIKSAAAVLVQLNFDEFWIAGLKDFSVCDRRAVGRCASDARSQERKSGEEKRCKVSAKTRCHVTVHKSDHR